MKKTDIIEEYNSLTSTLNTLLEEYKELTGKEWEGGIRIGNMPPSCVNDYKDHLEARLNGRKSNIHSIKEAINAWKRTEDLKSSEEGRNFIKSYEDAKDVLEKRVGDISKKLVDSFELCLTKVGMGDWKISRSEYMIPERTYMYFDIEKKDMKHVTLNISIDLEKGRGMEVSSSVHCGGRKNICDFDENYWQFKGYTLVHENHEVFNNWLNKDYRAAVIEVNDIQERIERIEQVLKDPMSEYIVKKIEKKMEM